MFFYFIIKCYFRSEIGIVGLSSQKKIIMTFKKQSIFILGAMVLAGCGGKTSSADPEADSLSTDSIVAAGPEDAAADTIVTKHYSFSHSNKYAQVDLSVDMPEPTDNNKEIIASLWQEYYKSVSSSYGDMDKRLFKSYSGNKDNCDDVLAFYGKSLFASLEEECKSEYEEMGTMDDSGDEESSASVPPTYARDVSLIKDYESERYVVFSILWYGYSGGAHGGALYSYLTYEKSTGKHIKNVLDPKCVGKLQNEMRKGLCAYLECDPSELNDYLQLDGNTIPFPAEPPHLCKDGVQFEYGQYEIGPYAMGMPSFIIGYDKLKDYLLITP